MAMTMPMPIAEMVQKAICDSFSQSEEYCAGNVDTTDEKIRIDMPLPMPRWVMSSPSHMTIAVPAVHVITMRAARHAENSGIRLMPCGSWKPELRNSPELPLFSANTNAVDCTRASATVR